MVMAVLVAFAVAAVVMVVVAAMVKLMALVLLDEVMVMVMVVTAAAEVLPDSPTTLVSSFQPLVWERPADCRRVFVKMFE